MVDALERLLQLTGVPVVLGLLALGAVPAVLGAWVRRQWRGHHDAWQHARSVAVVAGRHHRRFGADRRALLGRLRRDLRFDPRRWLVATALWVAIVVAWALVALHLLERVWVRNQLERDLSALPAGAALLVFGGWSAGLVYAVRVARDRRSGFTPTPAGAWPAVVRAVPLIFVLAGMAAWLTDRVGYPSPTALVAVLLPGTGLLVLSVAQDHRMPVETVALPAWLSALVPDAGPDRTAPDTVVARVVPPARPRRAHLMDAVGAYAARRLAARSTGPACRELLRVESAEATPYTAARWADLSAAPTSLTGRDPRRLGGYRVVERIGSGGMAVVFRGSSRSGQQVALKVPSAVSGADEQLRRRLAAEMRAMARLDVPGVVRIRDARDDDGLMYIAMDYLSGPTLDAAIVRLGPMSDPDALRALAVRLARALAGIHAAGVTHRDVKPKNIILTDAGPVLVDLGIAKVADATHRLTVAGVVGSAGYVPPEIHRGQPSGHDVDVWAWAGCVAFAAAGRPLFGGDTVHAVVANVVSHRPDPGVLAAVDRVDARLGDVVRRSIQPLRDERPVDGRALWQLLPPSGAWPAPRTAPVGSLPRRRLSAAGRR